MVNFFKSILVLIAFQVAFLGIESFAKTNITSHKQIVKRAIDETIPSIVSDFESINFEDDEVNFNSSLQSSYIVNSFSIFEHVALQSVNNSQLLPGPFGQKIPVYLQISKLTI